MLEHMLGASACDGRRPFMSERRARLLAEPFDAHGGNPGQAFREDHSMSAAGTIRTCRDVCCVVAIGGKADVPQAVLDNSDL
jgi:hypothetical protein